MVRAKEIREAIRRLGGEGGKELTFSQLYAEMGLEGGEHLHDRTQVRSRMHAMRARGEVQPAGRRSWRYVAKMRPQPLLEKVWRFIRIAKPGWTVRECALMSGASHAYLSGLLPGLELQGFIARMGDERRNQRFRTTALAMASPETPKLEARVRGPFQKERSAVLAILRLMLPGDLGSPRRARAIADAAQILVDTFGAIAAGVPEGIAEAVPEDVTQNENVKEESHG